ncbi:energy transducer TonB [Alteromonas ponticola]|uniref:TonB family protein n=1 Tax=Alteromonas ponticola TaxID=2720613 RepID=A0ABX1R083_9ALTE|nr:TonB family protein [Alteromonas ponticola]NMH59884.1 TonB family protein [Alteromonas ponticola]
MKYLILLISVVISGCAATKNKTNTAYQKKCYSVQYDAEAHQKGVFKTIYSPQLVNGIALAIEQLNHCGVEKARETVNALLPRAQMDWLLLASKRAEIESWWMANKWVEKGDTELAIQSGETWLEFTEQSHDPLIDKAMFIAYNFEGNEEKASEFAGYAFDTPEAAKAYRKQWEASFTQVEVGSQTSEMIYRESPVALKRIGPKYNEPGVIQLQFYVDVQGRATDVEVIESTSKGLSKSAVDALSGWRFLPAQDTEGNSIRSQIMKTQFVIE